MEKILVKIGDKVSEGTPILMFKGGDGAMTQPPSLVTQQEPAPQVQPVAVANTNPPPPSQAAVSAERGTGATTGAAADFGNVHASPSVRRVARELGVDLTRMKGQRREGSHHQGRRAQLPERAVGRAGSGGTPPAGPASRRSRRRDFSKFGPVEIRPLPRIQGCPDRAHRAWLNVPHVTHDDESDITEMDAYRRNSTPPPRQGLPGDAAGLPDEGRRVRAARVPRVQQLADTGEGQPDLQGYYHLGVAVDTPEGLVVPVIRDVDRKGITSWARTRRDLGPARRASSARPTCRMLCFTISSLGGIGGTSFTPIVNAPEVAILGVVRSKMAPVWDGPAFVPRLMLPLSLSYDHRVIDGALAARFVRYLCGVLEDIRRLVL